MRRSSWIVAVSAVVLMAGVWTIVHPVRDLLRGYVEARSADLEAMTADWGEPSGVTRFVYDDLGALSTDVTQVIPWKLVTTALVLARHDSVGVPLSLGTLEQLFAEFGFITPDTLLNWTGPPYARFSRPLGIITGYATRRVPRLKVELANIGCASCHAGVIYDSLGAPLHAAWLGLPNTSLNFETYARAVYRALVRSLSNQPRLVDAVRTLYPDVDPLELRTLERYVIPSAEQRLRELRETIDGPVPYDNGSPGLTHGVAALKLQLGLMSWTHRADDAAFSAIPDLGGTVLRTSLLYDAAFAPRGKERFGVRSIEAPTEEHLAALTGIVTFFTVPALGLSTRKAERALPRTAEIMRFVASYEPPPFPGEVDTELARIGGALFDQHCSTCHGDYSDDVHEVRLIRFPNRLVPQDQMQTDPHRWASVDDQVLAAIRATEYASHVNPARTGGYVAPPLTGLWATAPYLHNGSVPTLWHLMHPDQRPARFDVGGHRLDLHMVGIAGVLDADGTWRFPSDYQPWARPHRYDTSEPGLSNGGHVREFAGLSAEDKTALLEYLKLL